MGLTMAVGIDGVLEAISTLGGDDERVPFAIAQSADHGVPQLIKGLSRYRDR